MPKKSETHTETLTETLLLYSGELANMREFIKESFNPNPSNATKKLIETLRLANHQLTIHIKILQASQNNRIVKLTM